MQNLKWVFFIFFYGFTELTSAYTPKEGNVTANLGPFIYKTNFRGSDSGIQSPIKTGIGLLVNGDINENGALEIGIFYLDKYFFREKDSLYLAENTDLIHITMGYRRFLTSKLSSSLTLFSSYSVGDPHIFRTEFPPDQEVDTSARDITEYGFDLAVQYELWEAERIAVVSDIRYSYSVTNKLNERGDHYGTFISLRYFVQDKQGTYKKEEKKP
ncbi:MAG: hypothetical protein B7Y39_09695 [Bdellovibrio sp. 28-41-41]|nr:MAG: hypothetical protein B7Y39_09695 [Bdellovibrio sp. 28-41-41]